MSEYEASRAFAAPAELVFDEAADPSSMDEWLPHDVHLESADPPDVTVTHGAGAERERALMRAERDQLRVEWGTRDTDEYAGWLQVTGIEPDHSEVIVHLSFFDPAHAPPGPKIEEALDQSLDRLAEKVRHRSESAGG
ncbi:SRPBCC family protein [Actinoallomurus purpureus]|uniref:SRPBCC family protein n=1 Tax=Actinoallomurus purpureus TaxID=478114 RepID=UPI0020926458|nr:SRPBCC family protein [Actinoallomurus purpureus]MCO6010962.1 SRPBCC family protein [Actinoallomurus purpureus]